MSFLESIQHGLEKASQEAARITKIQHLHNVTTDLTFKTSQEGQRLIAQAMELYRSGHLAQGELVAVCQQIATYQQQINEVHEELQRLQKPEENAEPQAVPLAPPPTGYPAQYPAYAAPVAPTGYPAYPSAPIQPNYQGYPAYPSSPSGEPPTKPGTAIPEVQDAIPVSNEPPTQPGARKQEADAEKAPAHKKHQASAEPTSTATSAPGSYEDGVLPPVFSPFTNHPAPTGAGDTAEAEPEKPGKAHHSTKKATAEPEVNAETPAEAEPEKPGKAHHSTKKAAAEPQA